ncbi:ankyrin repeat-containing domain protein [Calycina marina]|uniref:Ankyrin repeat-containing domain protein n=1 Tax=Calycina marina TaxID=1763456 RepID=A0A9P7YWL0_9HELO|nr:ankyrin repeat-containing domain protein [Calycina marina]
MIEPSLRLRRAIHASDALLVRRILKSHPMLIRNPDTSALGAVLGLSNTSLHLAASLGHTVLVKTLLELGHEEGGVSLNEEHQTPLMLAARDGHTEVVHLLCTECPRSIAKRDIRGRDAIMEASKGAHDTCLQILLTYSEGGPVKMLGNADVDGNTALHFASSNGHLLVLRTLLAAGADSEKRNVWHWTPISYSATVEAEVYFRRLVAEVERRKDVRNNVEREGKGGAVRVVESEDL